MTLPAGPLDTRCPTCHAAPGWPCTYWLFGSRLTRKEPHIDRHLAAALGAPGVGEVTA